MVYIEKNNEGIRYFIYLISNNKIIPYIDTDIRKIIWNFLTTSYIILNVNNIQLKLNIYI